MLSTTMLRQRVLATLLLGTTACSGDSATPTTPTNSNPTEISTAARTYLNEVITTMQNNSMHRFKVNWTTIKTNAFAAAGAAQSIKDTYPGIRSALAGLGDGHSSYRAVDGTILFVSNRSCIGSGTAVPANIPPNIGWVRVSAFSGTTAQATAYAVEIQNAIRNADRDDMVGWIVDLRGNGGGNMWPMLAGLGPVLGEGLVGHFIDPTGFETRWEYRDGGSVSGSTTITRVDAPYTLKKPNPRVAVLVDNAVASSGEATFISFINRPNTRSFGVATCGLSTANAGIGLSDGALLNLTVALMADRTKKSYGDQVEPDERIVGTSAMFDRAMAWLQTGNP